MGKLFFLLAIGLVGAVAYFVFEDRTNEAPKVLWAGRITVADERVMDCLDRRSTFGSPEHVTVARGYVQSRLYIDEEGFRLQFSADSDGDSRLTVSANRELSRKQMADLEDCRALLPRNLRS